MESVQRNYDRSVVQWEIDYLYQYAGFAKALIQGDCDGATTN